MKRLWFLPVLLLCAFAVYASTTFTINPSEMKSGESKKLVDGDKTVTVTRSGDAIDVRIDGAGASSRLTISRSGGGAFHIGREGSSRTWVMPPGAVFGAPDVRSFRFRNTTKQTWFVCPKDHTMLRVPEGNEDDSFKCPVDGTQMEKRKGSGFAFYFNDDFEPESL